MLSEEQPSVISTQEFEYTSKKQEFEKNKLFRNNFGRSLTKDHCVLKFNLAEVTLEIQSLPLKLLYQNFLGSVENGLNSCVFDKELNYFIRLEQLSIQSSQLLSSQLYKLEVASYQSKNENSRFDDGILVIFHFRFITGHINFQEGFQMKTNQMAQWS